MTRARIALALIVSFACSTLTAFQAQAQFSLLRTEDIDLGKGRHTVNMRQVPGTFSSLRLRMRSGLLNVVKTTIFFSNGQRQIITQRITVRSRAFSSILSIRHNRQPITQILFEYARVAGRRAVLEIHGLRTPPLARPGQVARQQISPRRQFRYERVAPPAG